MPKYQLICECEASFEGWFPTSKDFDTQSANGQLVCPMCDSTNVRKDIQMPNIGRKSNQKSPRQRGKEKVQTMAGDKMVMGGRARTLLKQIQDHVEKNFENVGKDFAKEARKAANGKRNEEFYGTPNKKEVKELMNEGIDLFQVPKVKDN